MISDAWKEEKTKVSQPHLGEPRHGPHTPIFTEMAAARVSRLSIEKIGKFSISRAFWPVHFILTRNLWNGNSR